MSGPERTEVLIVTAMPDEIDLDTILARASHIHFQRRTAVAARIGETEVVIAATGEGAKVAGEGAAALCDQLRPAVFVGAGIAGALTPGLAVGDIVAASRVRDSGEDAPAPDAALLSRALGAGAVAGALLSVGKPLTSAVEKSRLAEALGGGAGAVDMESAAWARVAAARGIRFLALRSISDRADEDLPEYLARCLGEDGAIRRRAVVAHALARPWTIPDLFRMRRRMLDCGKGLSIFLERFLADGLS